MTRVGKLVSELGYRSEAAFSTAFKRVVGESPLRYRLHVRDRAVTAARPASRTLRVLYPASQPTRRAQACRSPVAGRTGCLAGDG
jgi:AraC-like DNA-binding protein